jgi:hypothetical protein
MRVGPADEVDVQLTQTMEAFSNADTKMGSGLKVVHSSSTRLLVIYQLPPCSIVAAKCE